jgi:hypothetical protein
MNVSPKMTSNNNPLLAHELSYFKSIKPFEKSGNKELLIGCALFTIGASGWTLYFGIHGDVEMSVLMGGFANISALIAAGVLMSKTKFAHSIRLTMVLALFVLSIEAPFYLHYVKGLDWGNAILPFFATPVLISYGIKRARLDHQLKAHQEFREVQAALQRGEECTPVENEKTRE